MLSNFALAAVAAAGETAEKIPDGIVVLMGIGTVFIGLICIIIICLITGAVYGTAKKQKRQPVKATAPEDPRKRQELIAAVCAACAEDMGEDISRLRVVSFKKIG